jgi:hypothetical protein
VQSLLAQQTILVRQTMQINYPGKRCCRLSGCKHRFAIHCCKHCHHSIFDREPSPVSDIDMNSFRRSLRPSKRLKSKRSKTQTTAFLTTPIVISNSIWNLASSPHQSTGYRGLGTVDVDSLPKEEEIASDKLEELVSIGYKVIQYKK